MNGDLFICFFHCPSASASSWNSKRRVCGYWISKALPAPNYHSDDTERWISKDGAGDGTEMLSNKCIDIWLKLSFFVLRLPLTDQANKRCFCCVIFSRTDSKKKRFLGPLDVNTKFRPFLSAHFTFCPLNLMPHSHEKSPNQFLAQYLSAFGRQRDERPDHQEWQKLTLLKISFSLCVSKAPEGYDLSFYIVFRPEPTFYPIERINGMIKKRNEFKISFGPGERKVKKGERRWEKNMKTQFEMKNTLNGFMFYFPFFSS